MPTNTVTDPYTALVIIVGIAPTVILLAFTALRAFRVGRALLVPVYRKQATWIGASAIFWVVIFVFILGTELIPGSAQVQTDAAASMFAGLFFGLVFTFAWVDSMAHISRNADPHDRDILRWRYLRYLMWAIIAASIGLGVYFAPSILSGVAGPPLQKFVAFYARNSPIFFLTSGVGALVLITGSYQSKDATLHSQLKWLGGYLLVLFVNIATVVSFTATSGGIIPSVLSPSFLPFLGGFLVVDFALAVSLFGASRSLVPLNRFPEQKVLT
jgi:hypothetical protein